MDDAQFWQLIEASRAGTDQAQALEDALAELPADEIVEFDRMFDRSMAGLYRWDLWGSLYVMKDGASDDAFDYFCAWIIGQGEQTYSAALADPRGYAMSIEPSANAFDGESLLYAAGKAHEKVAGEPLKECASVRPTDPLGEPWEEHDVAGRFPKLAAKWKIFREEGVVRHTSGGVASFFKKLFGKS